MTKVNCVVKRCIHNNKHNEEPRTSSPGVCQKEEITTWQVCSDCSDCEVEE